MIRYPNITGKNDAQKLDQMRSYLHQLADELNYQLDKTGNIGSGYPSSSVGAGSVAKPVKKDDAISNFNEIKGLIIKSADIVDAYSEEISKTLNGQYVAVSDFGTYKEETQAKLTASSDRIDSVVEKQEEIDTELVDLERTLRSEIEQTAESIKLEVIGGEPGKTASIKLTVGDKSYSGEIDMTGLVTFFNLTDGKTEISGDNIKTGQILADLIKAGTIKSKDGESVVIDLDSGTADIIGNVTTRTIDDGSGGVYVASLSPQGLNFGTKDSPYNGLVFRDHLQFFSDRGQVILDNGYLGCQLSFSSADGLSSASLTTSGYQSTNPGGGLEFSAGRGKASLDIQCRLNKSYIRGLTAPIDASDAVNKAYVDGNFAPAGYGLGVISKLLTSADDLNNIKANGWYKWMTDDAPANAPVECASTYYQCCRVWTLDGGVCFQEVMDIGHNPVYAGTAIQRTIYGSVAQPWDWVNPPMIEGAEYRTIERFQGRPVFVKCAVLDGQLPVAGATKYIPHGINMEYPIDLYGVYANQQAFVPNTNFDGITLTGTYVIVISDPQSGNPEANTLRLVIKYLKPGI